MNDKDRRRKDHRSEKKSFVLYYDYSILIERFTFEERGILFSEIFEFFKSQEKKTNLIEKIQIVYDYITARMKIDTDEYQAVCDIRSDNIKKRWSTHTNDTNEYKRYK